MGGKIIHGHSIGRKKSPEFEAWSHMMGRCNNPKNGDYRYYGGRGIKVCDRWKDFVNFLADMGPRPPGLTIDRHPNNDGDYEPGNCRWATRRQQVEGKRGNFQRGVSRAGNKAPNAKLNSAQVVEIKGLLGHTPQSKIAKQFGVAQSTIAMISTGKTWALHE